MNKHAQALYSEAVQYAFDQRFTESPEGPRELQEVINDKFLELIVGKCAEMVDKIDSGRSEQFHRMNGERAYTGDTLKLFFGVAQ